MKNISECITRDTEIVFAKNDLVYGNVVYSEKKIYWKCFSVNEFIGEALAKKGNIRTSNYFFIAFSNEERKRPFINSRRYYDKLDLNVGSYDFKEDGKRYYSLTKFGGLNGFNAFDEFHDILKCCPNDENKRQLTNEILEMFALDIYMAQKDRWGANVMIEVDSNNQIHLAPLFDYTLSFDKSSLKQMKYTNDLYVLDTKEDYEKLMEEFPNFSEILSSYQSVDLLKVIEEDFDDRKLNFSKFNFDRYKDFEEATQKRLRKILD